MLVDFARCSLPKDFASEFNRVIARPPPPSRSRVRLQQKTSGRQREQGGSVPSVCTRAHRAGHPLLFGTGERELVPDRQTLQAAAAAAAHTLLRGSRDAARPRRRTKARDVPRARKHTWKHHISTEDLMRRLGIDTADFCVAQRQLG